MKRLIYFFPLLFVANQLSAQCDSLLKDNVFIDPICENEYINLDLDHFSFTKGGKWTSSIENLVNNKVFGLVSQSAYLYYTISDSNCTATDSIYLKVKEAPEIKTINPADVCWNEDAFTLEFNATPHGGKWYDTSNVSNYIKDNKFDPSKTPKTGKIQKFALFYTYQDPNTKCRDTAALDIVVKPIPAIKLNYKYITFAIKDSFLNLDTIQTLYKNKGAWSGNGVIHTDSGYFFDPKGVSFDTVYSHRITYKYLAKVGSAPYCENSDELIIQLTHSGITTDNQEIDKEELIVYPNPSNGIIAINNPIPFSIKVYNVGGQLVASHATENNSLNFKLPKGSYWVVLKDVKHIKTQKVVVY